MALACPSCGSTDTVSAVQDNQCLGCGKRFDNAGNATEGGLDATTRAAIERRLEPRTTNVVGNLADLQRLGADQAPRSGGVADAFELPPGVTAAQAKEGNKVAAALVEAEAAGPAAVEPPEEQMDEAKEAEAAASKEAAKK